MVGGCGGSDTTSSSCFASVVSDPETKQKRYGSGVTGTSTNEDACWRFSKLAKTEDFSASKTMLRNTLLRSNSVFSPLENQNPSQMLSFSSSSPKLDDKCSPNVAFPYFPLSSPASSYNRIPGYSNGGFGVGTMHGVLAGARGPFTPSQWMELEQQALIYKYISANATIPPHLLLPIRKAFESAGISGFSGGFFRPTTLGWGGTFHLGFSNSTDPEPGRCRRTDGKKWRCSRDAVADQKYCERHMNRGRHRSRKPVEGQSGHSAAATNNNSTKLMPSASSVVGISGGGASSSLTVAQQQQFNNLQAAGGSNLSASAPLNRMFLNRENAAETPFFMQKQQTQFDPTSRNEFGVVSSDSLLNPTQKGSSLIRNLGSSSQETESQNCIRQFMDERTQLSISIPMAAASDFMSSTSSPNNENVSHSPLRMGLGIINESKNKQTNWIPVPWENSMGGPLGEVLHSTNNNAVDCKNSSASALNLMTEGWDNSSSLGSSPTGVLQRTTFASLSNSSAGSSPRADHSKTHEASCFVTREVI